ARPGPGHLQHGGCARAACLSRHQQGDAAADGSIRRRHDSAAGAGGRGQRQRAQQRGSGTAAVQKAAADAPDGDLLAPELGPNGGSVGSWRSDARAAGGQGHAGIGPLPSCPQARTCRARQNRAAAPAKSPPPLLHCLAMDVSDLIATLNDAQREAVTAPQSPILVLAGAGTGKTRVLTNRAAWLTRVEQESPYSFFAVTFTNKAAAEMRGRIEQLLGITASGMWIGTFHGLAHRFLRSHWREAGLPQSFQILDADDQLRLLRRLLRSLEIDEDRWPPRMVASFINNSKDEGLRPQDIVADGPFKQQLVQLYAAYQEAC